jgi:hypothetical protein
LLRPYPSLPDVDVVPVLFEIQSEFYFRHSLKLRPCRRQPVDL